MESDLKEQQQVYKYQFLVDMGNNTNTTVSHHKHISAHNKNKHIHEYLINNCRIVR